MIHKCREHLSGLLDRGNCIFVYLTQQKSRSFFFGITLYPHASSRPRAAAAAAATAFSLLESAGRQGRDLLIEQLLSPGPDGGVVPVVEGEQRREEVDWAGSRVRART
jgi:hypothetical protein